MQPWFLRFYRVVEVALGGLLVSLGVVALLAGLSRNDPNAWRMPIGAFAVAAFIVAVVEARFAAWRRVVAGVTRGLDAVAQRDLESPQPAAQRSMDEVVQAAASQPGTGAMARGLASSMAANSVRLCAHGKWQGRDVEIGTVLSPGRSRDSKISYVCIRDPRVRGPFVAMTRGVSGRFAHFFMPARPVSTGDAAFDARWMVDGDEAIARAALDDETRAKLLQLESHVTWLRSANVQVMPYGLVVRWPGLLSYDGAAFLRDLAVHIHERIVRAA